MNSSTIFSEKNQTQLLRLHLISTTHYQNFLVRLIVGISQLNLLERFIVYISFFGSFILLIYVLSKCNKKILILKKRRQNYGFYLSQKQETKLTRLAQRMHFYVAGFFHKTSQHRRKTKTNDQVIVVSYSKLDMGHDNELFETDSYELPSIEIKDFAKENLKLSVSDLSSIKSNGNFLKAFLFQHTSNSLSYRKLSSNWSDSESNSSFEEKCKASLLVMSKSASNQTSISSFMPKIFTRKRQNLVLKTESDKSSLNSSSLPLILITDTSSMQTSVLDLETFEPESRQNKLTTSQSLLNYYFEDRVQNKR